ncbi:hypothetical protein EYV94_21470 [Puteibacter caeruleilacunae]|nr:hypothetical protein EYV94_21470 [Puteibacter caeruleilacunae]
MVFWLIFIVMSCCAIAVQDFKNRAVYWWLFPLLLLGMLGYAYQVSGKVISWDNLMVNLIVAITVTALCSLYYLVRYGLNGFERLYESIGMGDMVMLPVLLVSFSPLNFIVFMVGSLFIALLGFALVSTSRRNELTIPLAGYWAILLLVVLMGAHLGTIDINNDNWIMLWLMN